MAYQINKRILVAKRETTPGTVAAPASADFNVRVRGIENNVPVIAQDDDSAKFATGDHGMSASIPSIHEGAPPFFWKLSYSGAASTAPKWGKFAQMSGLLQTTVGATGVKWEDHPDADKQTGTVDVYDILIGADAGSQRTRFAGVMGNLVMSAEGVGSPILCRFSPRGKWVTPNTAVAAASIPVLTSADSTAEERFIGCTISIGGVAYKVSSFEFDLGADIQLLDGNESGNESGIEYGYVANRNGMRLSMNMRKLPVAVDDLLAKVKDGTIISASIQTSNFTFKWPRLQVMAPEDAVLNGDVRHSTSFRPLRNGSADATVNAKSSFQLVQGSLT